MFETIGELFDTGTLRDPLGNIVMSSSGTGSYKSPEKDKKSPEPWTKKSDIYSMGKVFSELYFGTRMPIKLIKGKAKDVKREVEKEFFALIMMMLNKHGHERPNVEKCKEKLMELKRKYGQTPISYEKKRKCLNVEFDSKKRKLGEEDPSSLV